MTMPMGQDQMKKLPAKRLNANRKSLFKKIHKISDKIWSDDSKESKELREQYNQIEDEISRIKEVTSKRKKPR